MRADRRRVEAPDQDDPLPELRTVGGVETIEDVVEVTAWIDARGAELIEERAVLLTLRQLLLLRTEDGRADEPPLEERSRARGRRRPV